jgi:hypothetical protein
VDVAPTNAVDTSIVASRSFRSFAFSQHTSAPFPARRHRSHVISATESPKVHPLINRIISDANALTSLSRLREGNPSTIGQCHHGKSRIRSNVRSSLAGTPVAEAKATRDLEPSIRRPMRAWLVPIRTGISGCKPFGPFAIVRHMHECARGV